MTSVNPDLAGIESRLTAAWPHQRMRWLMQAAVAEPDRALAGWRSWLAASSFDAAPITEIRLMAPIAPRLRQFDPDFPELARVNGFRRFVLSHTHERIKGTLPMLRALSQAGVRMMLIKGAARLAIDPTVAAERFMADIDVLVQRADWPKAMAVAKQQGWAYLPPPRTTAAMNSAGLDDIYPFRHSVDFTVGVRPTEGRLDLHHHARHTSRMPGDDDAIWADAAPVTFLGIAFVVPAPTDRLLISTTHGLRRAMRRPTGEWALDAASVIRHENVDWDRLVSATLATRTQAVVGSALLLLQRELGLPVPDEAITALRRQTGNTLLEELAFLGSANYGGTRTKQSRLLAARDAVTGRAKAALDRMPVPPPRRQPTLPPIPTPQSLKLDEPLVFHLPDDLRQTDMLVLEIKCRVVGGDRASQMVLECPYLVLERFRLPPAKAGSSPMLFARTIQLKPSLFIAGEMRSVQLSIHGGAIIDRLEMRWRRSPTLVRIERRLAGLLSRVRIRLGPRRLRRRRA